MKPTEYRSVPFFNYPALFAPKEHELLEVVRDVCSRGAYILQKDLKEFESNLGKFLDVRHVFGVANGTDALIIALRAAGIEPGDEVILPAHTYIASAASIHLVGGVPVLAECGPDHMLDPVSVASKVTGRTRAIMPVQINGRTCDMDALQEIADRHGLQMVEDAAQGLGSKFKDKFAGTFGIAGTFSFYPAKLLGCFGDGGAIVTNNDEVAHRISLLRDHGRNEAGRVVAWGYNSRLDNLQAAILNHKLATFQGDIARRREIATKYFDGLKDLQEVVLPPTPGTESDHFDVFQNFELEADRRDELRNYLESVGIKTIIQWAGTPVHQFEELGFDATLPYTDAFFKRCMMLPMNTSLTDEDVEYICWHVRKFFGRVKP